MDVQITDMPEYYVGCVRHIGPYNQIAQACERLGAIAGPAGLLQQPGAVMIALYHDDPDTVPLAQLRSDAGIAVPEQVRLPEGLVAQRIPAGRYAWTVHVGPYEQLGDAWRGSWASGFRRPDTASGQDRATRCIGTIRAGRRSTNCAPRCTFPSCRPGRHQTSDLHLS